MTIKDIARESGYAVGTVSRVLNNNPRVSEDARRKILAVVAQHGYQPNANAKHLKQQVPEGLALYADGLLQQRQYRRAGLRTDHLYRAPALRPLFHRFAPAMLYPGAGVAGHPLPAADEQRRRAGH